MSGLDSLISKDFKVLLYLYDNRQIGNIINMRQIDVAKKFDVTRNTIISIYKNLTDLGYIASNSDKYYLTKEGIKVCEEYNKVFQNSKVIMYCTKCGNPITEDWDFCKCCGNSLKDNEKEDKKDNNVLQEIKENINLKEEKISDNNEDNHVIHEMMLKHLNIEDNHIVPEMLLKNVNIEKEELENENGLVDDLKTDVDMHKLEIADQYIHEMAIKFGEESIEILSAYQEYLKYLEGLKTNNQNKMEIYGRKRFLTERILRLEDKVFKYNISDLIKEFDENYKDDEWQKYKDIKEMVEDERKRGVEYKCLQEYIDKRNERIMKIVKSMGLKKINKKDVEDEICKTETVCIENIGKENVGLSVNNKKLLIIDAPFGCHYLTSFILAYQNYLKMFKHIRCNVLFNCYDNYKFTKLENTSMFTKLPHCDIKMENKEELDRYINQALNNKQSNVFYETYYTDKNGLISLYLFLNTFADIYIIVNFNNYKEDMYKKEIKGETVSHLYAMDSISDMDFCGSSPDETIVSTYGLASNIVIPYIKNFGYDNSKIVRPAGRYNKYFEACYKTVYNRIDKLLKLEE